MKDKIDYVLGHRPWEIEILYHVERGLEPEVARFSTIMHYAVLNDLRPLRDAIAKAKRIDGNMAAIDAAILGILVLLIDNGRLVVKRRRGGKPKVPAKWARDFVGARRFEKRIAKKSDSDAAFRETANELGMTEVALREAVTRWRKVNAG